MNPQYPQGYGQPAYGYPMPQYPGYPQPGMPQPGMPQPGVMPGQPYPMPVAPQPGMVPGQPMPGYPGVPGMPAPVPQAPAISHNDAEAAASSLYGAFKGIGADHSEVIKILSSHNKSQLSIIAAAYYSKYGETLESRVKKELTGNYEKLALAILHPPYKLEASLLKKAMGTKEERPDYDLISSILTSRTNVDIQQIVMAGMEYKRKKPGKAQKQKDNLMNKILKQTEEYKDFHNLCRAIFTTRREVGPANPARASGDAKDLIIAAKGIGCDAKIFISILTARSYPHIRKIAEEVEAQKKMSLKKLIYKEFTMTMEKGLATILNMATSPAHAQAYVMYRAMKGVGTDDSTLIASIAYIYDNDMLGKVKEAFKELTGKDLVKEVEKETSLNYKKLCTALLNYRGVKSTLPMNVGY